MLKNSPRSWFPVAIGAALTLTVTVVVAALVEAVTGMQSFL